MTRMVTGDGAAAHLDDDPDDRYPASDDVPDPAPPAFGTAPWGYRRSEVDAWAVWVNKLIAHGRKETIRADSAEATLQATLARLDQLERRLPPEDAERPAGGTASAPAGSTVGPGTAGTEATVDTGATADAGQADRAEQSLRAASSALPRRTPGAAGMPAPSGNRGGAAPAGPAALGVVESTLHEMMTLLHHLVDSDGSRPQDSQGSRG